MRFTRTRVLGLAALALAAALTAAALRPEAVEVESALAARRPLSTTVDAEGRVRVRERYVVTAPVAGRLERLTLREGAMVEAGDVVARLAPLPLDAPTVEQARARVAAVEALHRETDARAVQAGERRAEAARAASRARRLAEAGALPEAELEAAERLLRLQEQEHAAAGERVRATAADVRATRATLAGLGGTGAHVVVRAPSAGRVLRVPERSGRVVAAGTPLLELGDARTVEVVADVLSSDAVQLCEGDSVIVDGWGGEAALAGRVRVVEPAAFTRLSALGVEEQRVNVVIDVLDPPATLGDGYRVDTHSVIWSSREVLAVPPSALFRDGERSRLFVVEEGRARARVVSLGHRSDDAVEVTSGVAAGERVILFPSDRVADGARVRVR